MAIDIKNNDTTSAADKAAAEKAAVEKTAADSKAKAEADAKAKAEADAKAAAEKGKKDDSGADGDAGLAGLFGEESEDKTGTKPTDKGGKLSIAIPDDLKDAVETKTLDGYAAKAAELGLTQQQLDGLVGHHFDALREQVASVEAEYRTQVTNWVTELKTDPEIGGAKLKESLALAKEGALRLGGQALVQYLRESGLGNQPVLFRALRNAGLRMRDDTFGGFGQIPRGGDEQLTTEQRQLRKRYPSHSQKRNGT